jgi:hypothetical protein
MDIENKEDNDFFYNILVDERYKLGDYLRKNVHNINYDNIKKNLIGIYKKKSIDLQEIFHGKIGPEHNGRMRFDIFPTIEFFEQLKILCTLLNIKEINELNSGIGFFTMLLKEYLGHDNPICVSAYDNKNILETILNPGFTRVTKRSIIGFTMCRNFNSDCCYIITSEPVDRYSNFEKEIEIFIKKINPKILIILDQNANTIRVNGNKYKIVNFIPMLFSYFDTAFIIEKNLTNMNTVMYIRNDCWEYSDQIKKIFDNNKTKKNDVECEYIIRKMIHDKMIPSFLAEVSIEDMTNIIKQMHNIELSTIPLYLDTIDDILFYINIYSIAISTYENIPDGIESKDKFELLKKYNNLVINDIDKLIEMQVIPTLLKNDQEDAIAFLVGDYMYRSKQSTNISSFF